MSNVAKMNVVLNPPWARIAAQQRFHPVGDLLGGAVAAHQGLGRGAGRTSGVLDEAEAPSSRRKSGARANGQSDTVRRRTSERVPTDSEARIGDTRNIVFSSGSVSFLPSRKADGRHQRFPEFSIGNSAPFYGRGVLAKSSAIESVRAHEAVRSFVRRRNGVG